MSGYPDRRYWNRAADPEAWKARAVCRDMDLSLFFPERGRPGLNDVRAVCASCPVREDCLEYALVNVIQQGIWGGKSERERRRLRNARRRAAA